MDKGVLKYVIAFLYGTIKGFATRLFGGFLRGIPDDVLMVLLGWLVKKWKPEYAEIGDAIIISALAVLGLGGVQAVLGMFTGATTTTTAQAQAVTAEAVEY
jgi:drug/metabolite transporter (DMT)-like permease